MHITINQFQRPELPGDYCRLYLNKTKVIMMVFLYHDMRRIIFVMRRAHNAWADTILSYVDKGFRE